MYQLPKWFQELKLFYCFLINLIIKLLSYRGKITIILILLHTSLIQKAYFQFKKRSYKYQKNHLPILPSNIIVLLVLLLMHQMRNTNPKYNRLGIIVECHQFQKLFSLGFVTSQRKYYNFYSKFFLYIEQYLKIRLQT